MVLGIFVQNVVFGILVGALYGLAAVGLSLIFGVMRVLNVSHGELIMLGGYASFWFFALYNIDPFLSLALTVPILFILGLGLQKCLFSHVAKFEEEARIKNSLLVGFGLSLVFHNLAIRLWTADERTITTLYSGTVFKAMTITFPLVRVAGLAIAFVTIMALQLFLTQTYTGKAIRATSEDWEAATLMGISTEKTYLISFGLGSALAAVAGTLLTVGYSVHPAVGLEWTLKALIVVVLAGLGSMIGAFVGGIVLGVAESASTFVIGGPYREVVGLVIFLLVLVLRPQGLFGRK